MARILALLNAEGGRYIGFEVEDGWLRFDAANVFEPGGYELGLSCYAGCHKAGENGESRHGLPSSRHQGEKIVLGRMAVRVRDKSLA
jgi:hypothetical protein